MIDVAAAASRLAPYAQPTPLVRSLLLDVFIKNETVSQVASFKWRGALNAILDARPAAVVTSSSGNHGQGVAWAARQAGIPAHIFLPTNANPTKRRKIELLGATIHDAGRDIDDAKIIAMNFASDANLVFIDDGENERVIEGAGTVGLEIAGALESIDTVYVPMGSGSLASGVAIAVKQKHPRARVIAVQAKGSPAMIESFHARRAIERPIDTLADGLVCRVPARLALELLIRHVDDAVSVTDEELLAATRRMILDAQLLVEPSGAAGLAAALRDQAKGNVVIIATGSNITAALLAQISGIEN